MHNDFFFMYSTIPLIWHPLNQIGAKLSSIPDYQTVPKFFSQPSENVHLSVILISPYKNFAFNYHRPSHGSSIKTYC